MLYRFSWLLSDLCSWKQVRGKIKIWGKGTKISTIRIDKTTTIKRKTTKIPHCQTDPSRNNNRKTEANAITLTHIHNRSLTWHGTVVQVLKWRMTGLIQFYGSKPPIEVRWQIDYTRRFGRACTRHETLICKAGIWAKGVNFSTVKSV